ncbi:MAG: hypothetical protein Q7V56_14805 [Gammaproteobacteria bacterium]|nr:hypothetical protein [Gammaproteobacteria bacterium]
MKELIFDLDHWEWKCLEDFGSYQDIHDFVGNQQAVDAHKSSMTYFAIDPASHPENTDALLRTETEVRIKKSLFHFASSSIVSLCTTYEVASKQFFKCLFVNHPMFMYDFIGAESRRGTIKLKDVVEARNYGKVIEDAANNAASAATKGKYSDILKRAAKLCDAQTNEQLVNQIDTIQRLRNRIVHEKESSSFGVKDVGEAHQHIAQAIENLGHFAIKMDVPGRYTYILPEGTLVLSSIAFVAVDGA